MKIDLTNRLISFTHLIHPTPLLVTEQCLQREKKRYYLTISHHHFPSSHLLSLTFMVGMNMKG